MSGWHTRMGGVPVGFSAPAWLWVAGAALVVGVAAAVWAWRRRTAARGWVSPRLAARLVEGGSPRAGAVRALLWALGMALLATAMARPQAGATEERMRRRGLDVVAVLDASRSMLARDVAPDRIGRAKLEVESLLDELAGDRIGLVTFSSDGFVQMPLTTDYAAARTFLRQIDPRQLPQGGTNIGAGLRSAQQLLAASSDKGAHVVLLFSDGEDWQGDAVDSAAALRRAGTTVYTVGVGTAAGAPVQSASGRTVVSRAEPTGLAAIAKAGGGAMWSGDGAVGAIASKLAGAQKSELEERRVVAYRERYQGVVAAGLLALACAALFGGGRRRRRERGRGGVAITAVAALAVVAGSGGHARAAEWTRAPEPATQAGVQQYRHGKYGDALQAFERAPAKGAASATVAYDRATALYKLGRYEEARRAFAEAARAGGSVGVDAELGVGNSAAKLGDKDGAVAAYRRTLERAPEHADARHNLEVLLAEQKRDDEQKKQKQQQQAKNDKQQQNKQQSQNQKQQAQNQKQQSQNQEQQSQQQQQKQQEKQQQQANQQQQNQQHQDKQQSPNQQQQAQQQQQQQQQAQQQQQQAQQQPSQPPRDEAAQKEPAHGTAQPAGAMPHALDRGGFGEPRSAAARRLLDSMQRDARVLPVWRFSRAAQPRRTDAPDKDW